mmetsp:Transcript_72686/g.236041  ORF Transcript_72686/g.236041 Transcript_72686/m.236041 type:complete len:103 (+) Transcript_72686:192-500(+)
MLKVVRLGGPVILRHIVNAGAQHAYAGLRQWNMDIQDGRFIIWRPASDWRGTPAVWVDVMSHLVSLGLLAAEGVEIRSVEPPADVVVGERWVDVVLWRSATL